MVETKLKSILRFPAYLLGAVCVSLAHAGAYVDFFRALSIDNTQTVSALLARGFDPNTVDERGQPALQLSLREEAFRVAELLLAQPQLRIDQPNRAGETALMQAAIKGQTAWVGRLLDRGARVEGLAEAGGRGWTPLHYAASGPALATAQLLLARGARLDAPAPNGITPLMMAARYGPEDTALWLLGQGADAGLRDDSQRSAADHARQAGRDRLAERLAARSAAPSGETPSAPAR